jgi:hypothetical protein
MEVGSVGTLRERKKIWPNALEPRVEHFWQQVYDYLNRHLVCLGVRYVPINAQGEQSGKERLMRYSCFVVSLCDKWFLVTAGHALKELAELLQARKIRIVHSFLADYFGHRDTVRRLTPFPFDCTEQHYMDEITLGLDYAFIPLRDIFKWGMESNGIKPLSEKHWTDSRKVEFAVYTLLGFPEEVATDYDPNIEVEHPEHGSIGSVVLSVEAHSDKSLIPDSVNSGLITGPWFTGRITANTKLDIGGMSGGPIFGLCQGEGGLLTYSVVAIQSRWHKTSKVIFGCPIKLFGEMVERYAAGLLAQSFG